MPTAANSYPSLRKISPIDALPENIGFVITDVFHVLENMQQAGPQKKDLVDLISRYNGTERIAPKFIVVPYEIPRGCTATYFPEANVLVPIESVAEKSNTPVSKLVKVRVKNVFIIS